MSSKKQRQQMVARIIASEEVSSQPQLQRLLAEQGLDATQATRAAQILEHHGAKDNDPAHAAARRSGSTL